MRPVGFVLLMLFVIYGPGAFSGTIGASESANHIVSVREFVSIIFGEGTLYGGVAFLVGAFISAVASTVGHLLLHGQRGMREFPYRTVAVVVTVNGSLWASLAVLIMVGMFQTG